MRITRDVRMFDSECRDSTQRARCQPRTGTLRHAWMALYLCVAGCILVGCEESQPTPEKLYADISVNNARYEWKSVTLSSDQPEDGPDRFTAGAMMKIVGEFRSAAGFTDMTSGIVNLLEVTESRNRVVGSASFSTNRVGSDRFGFETSLRLPDEPGGYRVYINFAGDDLAFENTLITVVADEAETPTGG
jgi:hypothetical protein